MAGHLSRDLESLERDFLPQSSMVEELINKACPSLRKGQTHLTREAYTLED